VRTRAAQGVYRGFEDARDVARAMGLNSSDDWEKIVSRGDCPVDIPQVSACPSSPSTERACVCLELLERVSSQKARHTQ
jgi:hypothetical protein